MRSICLVLGLFLLVPAAGWSQDRPADSPEMFYKIAGGIGWGTTSHTEVQDAGPTFFLELGVERNRTNYLAGIRTLSEFNLFNDANVTAGINSYELKGGRTFGDGKMHGEVNAGVAYVHGRVPGEVLGRTGGLFGSAIYSKWTYNAVGFPVSLKGYIQPHHVGVGIELYANLNNKNSFFAISFLAQWRKKKGELDNRG